MTLGMVMTFRYNTKDISMKKKIVDELKFIKIKNSHTQGHCQFDDKSYTGRKYLQKTHLRNYCYQNIPKKSLKLNDKKMNVLV